MSWQTELVLILRNMIDDFECPETYSDSRLQQLLALAGQKVMIDVDINVVYSIVFSKNPTISPDPTESPRDDTFINLMLLKAACIIDHIEAKKAVDNGLMFRDGESWGDTRDVGKNRLALLKIGFCSEYDQAVIDYQMGIANVGVAIISPFRLYNHPRELHYGGEF